MPKLNQGDTTIPGSGSFTFSYVAPEHLQELSYTVVTIALDVSTSVDSYSNELLSCIQNIIRTCRRSPKAENILIRVVYFSSSLKEAHGFKLLKDINEDSDYTIDCSGITALYNTFFENINAAVNYSNILVQQDFDVNIVNFVVTDGGDNASTVEPSDIKDLIETVNKSEEFDSVTNVLVGIGTDNPSLEQTLRNFQQAAGISQFVPIGNATPADLAKLGIILSKSISIVSQSLGTGQKPVLNNDPSSILVF